MTWANYAHRVEEGLPDGARARLAMRAEPATATPVVARRPGPPHVRAVLDLQRAAGNRAVVQLLRRDVPIQRQDEEYEDAGAGWSTNEGAPAGSYSADDYSSGEAYGPPPPPEWSDGSGGSDAGQSWASGESEETTEPAGGGGGGGGGGGSEWSSAGGGGSGGGEATGGGGEPAPADEGSSWWPFGGGEETPRNEPGESAPGGDEGGGSSWWPFGGGEETPAGDDGGGSSWWPFGGGGEEAPGGDDGGGSSWWPFGGDDTPRNEPGEEPEDRPQDDIDQKIAEGESGSETDVFVPMGGGPNPIAKSDAIPAARPGGFHDDGNVGTVPVGRRAEDEDPADAMNPHAFIRGGRTGTIAWAGGGGEGLGPKGDQGSGSLQTEIAPEYDYHWGGPFTNASSFVEPSTGVVDVHRSYKSSKPGDQGNGWWVSEAAANALTAHEQKHVARSSDLYDRIIEPMTVKIRDSATWGKERAYLGSDAKAALKVRIDWANTVKKFKDEDMAENAPNNRVDNEDVGAPHYPEPRKDPRVIEGKLYEHWEIMHGEKPPP
jgi:hypothetical protein